MKKQNIRNTVIGAVIAVAMLAAVTLFTLWRLGIFDRTPAPVPNAAFGGVMSRYRPNDAVVIGDCIGDTDVVSIDCILPNESDRIYDEYVAKQSGNDGSHFSPVRRSWKTTSDGLTLHLLATVHIDEQLVQTSLSSLPGSFTERQKNPYHTGKVEKLVNGEWLMLRPLEVKHVYSDAIYVEVHDMPIYGIGSNHIVLPFPIHEPGEYRITYNFRTIAHELNSSSYTLGDEVYTVTQMLTIPEPSGNKFDVVAVDLDHSDGTAQVAALIRSNDGTIPLQNLRRTRLERQENGEWVDVSDTLVELYEIQNNMIHAYSYTDYSDVAYEPNHPFSNRTEHDLFCGIAAFDGAVAGEYRLTLEFADSQMPDAARYALQLELELS